jgi:hypothetical protein
MPVAGLCPACSRGPMAAGLDELSASRGSHLDFALDAHALASGLPRSSVRLTVRHLLRPAFRRGTCRYSRSGGLQLRRSIDVASREKRPDDAGRLALVRS